MSCVIQKYMESQKAKQKVPEAPRVVAPEPVVSPQQSEMIALFSQQSGMNAQFSALLVPLRCIIIFM